MFAIVYPQPLRNTLLPPVSSSYAFKASLTRPRGSVAAVEGKGQCGTRQVMSPCNLSVQAACMT